MKYQVLVGQMTILDTDDRALAFSYFSEFQEHVIDPRSVEFGQTVMIVYKGVPLGVFTPIGANDG